MPVLAHQHQPSPIPPVIAMELRHEHENFREYFHWNGLCFAADPGQKGRGPGQRPNGGRGLVRRRGHGRGRGRGPEAGPARVRVRIHARLTKATREMARDGESSAGPGTTLVDPVRVCTIHASGAWLIRQGCMWTISPDRASQKVHYRMECASMRSELDIHKSLPDSPARE